MPRTRSSVSNLSDGTTSKLTAVNVIHPGSFLGSMKNMTPETIKSLHNVVDIANGRENVAITLVNEVNDECPPSFHYIRTSLVFENAYVNFPLARIGDQSCCSSCSGDCLSASKPCACALESGGEFAYTPDGLVKEEFLEECISMTRDPKNHCQFFCKECPLERAEGADNIEPCKGHLIRKFIKECWSKCSCHTRCGNRVIQRGISYNLQVFMTSEEKGWGLRTLVDLPKGAFVCEYAGEILTNSELYDRGLRLPKGERHTYPMLLDADWGAEGHLKDDEALCLDASYYGNVGRFINHRCGDSNLVDIPVEVETSDHHIYHVAFFTTRKVKAMEELTWDYGIDFDNHDHPIKAFPCQCGSKFCYNIMRSRMENQKAIVPHTPQVNVSIVVDTRQSVQEEHGDQIVYESRTKANAVRRRKFARACNAEKHAPAALNAQQKAVKEKSPVPANVITEEPTKNASMVSHLKKITKPTELNKEKIAATKKLQRTQLPKVQKEKVSQVEEVEKPHKLQKQNVKTSEVVLRQLSKRKVSSEDEEEFAKKKSKRQTIYVRNANIIKTRTSSQMNKRVLEEKESRGFGKGNNLKRLPKAETDEKLEPEFHTDDDCGARENLLLAIKKMTKAVLQFRDVMSRIGKAKLITHIFNKPFEHLLSSQDAQPYQNEETDEKLEMEFHTDHDDGATKKVVLALTKMTEVVLQFRDAMSRMGKAKIATYILKKSFDLLSSQDAQPYKNAEQSHPTQAFKPEPSDVQPNHKSPPQNSPAQNDLWDDDFFNQPNIANALFQFWDGCSKPKKVAQRKVLNGITTSTLSLRK